MNEPIRSDENFFILKSNKIFVETIKIIINLNVIR